MGFSNIWLLTLNYPSTFIPVDEPVQFMVTFIHFYGPQFSYTLDEPILL